MDDEINSLIDNQTFVTTEIPASKMLLKENGFIQANWKLMVKLKARQICSARFHSTKWC